MAKIMVADDAAFVRLTLRQILENAGHMVVAEAADGDEAYELYRETKPDVILMDITMPECTGIEGLKKIRQFDPEAKCIICSAMGQQTLVVEAMQCGARDFIVKPFRPERVLESISVVLGKK
ncbi:MAG: response regulator [Lachnospiraceae bacterium]|nr:response regulator [Lachnospiraceae bacterium]MBP5185031.1 response regulator [Lachnospiraceae bacterium]